MTDYGHNGGPSDDGWIKRYRVVRDHWLVGHGIHVKPADPSRKRCHTQGEAWEDLLMECRYYDGYVMNGGKKMELRRGELLGAVSWLANRWNWTPKTVRRFLDQLEADGMIELISPGVENGKQQGKQSSVVSVCNYDEYQSSPQAKGQATGQAEGTQRASKGQAEGKQGARKGQAEGNIYKEEEGKKEIPPLAPPRGGDATKVGSARKGRGSRGERLPDGWVLPKSWGEWALEHFEATPDEIRAEAAAFRDFWVSKPGSAGCKLDWSATWRNWVRSTAGRKRWPIRRPESDVAPDIVLQATTADKASELASLDDARQRELVAANANGIWPMDKLLYPPGHPKCVIRPENYRAVGIDEETYDQNGIRRDGGH